jgi:isopenicillin N synthase-like dioxygenase
LPLISETIDETTVYISFAFNAEDELKKIVETQDYQNQFTAIILNTYTMIQSYEDMLSYQERLMDAIAKEFELDPSIIDVALVSQFPYQ